MTLGLTLLWIAGVLLMAGLIELWFYWDRHASHVLLQAFLLVGAVFAFFTPLALALVPGAVLWGLVRLIQVETSRRRTLSSEVQPEPSPGPFRRIIKWVFRIAGRAATDPVVEHLLAAHQRFHRDKQEIDRAMQANPGDPALLRRIQRLTAEVESTDRAVLGRLNWPAALAFGAEETPPLLRRLWRREHRPKLRPLVRGGVLLLVVTGIVHFVAVALTQGRHHPSSQGAAGTTFREPDPSGYTSSEVVSMVESKLREEALFSPSSETITCPEGAYAPNARVTCTLRSPNGGGNFDVEVTEHGVSIKAPGEAG
jgi:hypothetical protein